jgi:hypothetical protein
MEPRAAAIGGDVCAQVAAAFLGAAAPSTLLDRLVPVHFSDDAVLYGAASFPVLLRYRDLLAGVAEQAALPAPASGPRRYLAQCPVRAYFPEAEAAVATLWGDVAARMGGLQAPGSLSTPCRHAPGASASGCCTTATASSPHPLPASPPANVWLNVEPAISATHFDDDDGVLVVVRGRKTVTLSPPRLHDPLLVNPLWSPAYHHAAVGASPPPGGGTAPASMVELRPGDALLIPAGYWHHVASEAGTLAINFWFPPVAPHPAVAARKLIRDMVEDTLAASRAASALAARRRLAARLRWGSGGGGGGGEAEDGASAAAPDGAVVALLEAAAASGERAAILNDIVVGMSPLQALRALCLVLEETAKGGAARSAGATGLEGDARDGASDRSPRVGHSANAVIGTHTAGPAAARAVWESVAPSSLATLAAGCAGLGEGDSATAAALWQRIWCVLGDGAAADVDGAVERGREAAYRDCMPGLEGGGGA